jgi:hypothetical protein
MNGIDHRDFEFQAGSFVHADRFSKTGDDRGLVLMDGEKKRAPFECGEEKDETDNREHWALDEIDEAGGEMWPVN